MRLAEIREAVARHGRAVLVLVSEAQGSAPREAGAAMLVAPEGALGTVGGGTVEHRACEIARAMLAGGAERQAERQAELDFPLGPALDQCCGGRMRLAFALLTAGSLAPPGETLGARQAPPLPPPGGGRGGGLSLIPLRDWNSGPAAPSGASPRRPGRPSSTAPAMSGARWSRRWRRCPSGRSGSTPARAPARAAPPGVEVHETPLPEAVAERAEPDALHVVLTHSHALDLEIVSAVMARPFGFCGLIGSATKRTLFRRGWPSAGSPPRRSSG